MDNRDLWESEHSVTIQTTELLHCGAVINVWPIVIIIAILYGYQVGLAYIHDSNQTTRTRRWIRSLLFIPLSIVNCVLTTTRVFLLFYMISSFITSRTHARPTGVSRTANTTPSIAAVVEIENENSRPPNIEGDEHSTTSAASDENQITSRNRTTIVLDYPDNLASYWVESERQHQNHE